MSNTPLLLHEYCGYVGSIEYSKEDKIFYGSVQFITDTIAYESEDLQSLESAFHRAVDEYIEDCKALAREPNTTCKGSFNVRLPKQLHVELVQYGIKHGISLNKTITIASEKLLEQDRALTIAGKPTPIASLNNLLDGFSRKLYGEIQI